MMHCSNETTKQYVKQLKLAPPRPTTLTCFLPMNASLIPTQQYKTQTGAILLPTVYFTRVCVETDMLGHITKLTIGSWHNH